MINRERLSNIELMESSVCTACTGLVFLGTTIQATRGMIDLTIRYSHNFYECFGELGDHAISSGAPILTAFAGCALTFAATKKAYNYFQELFSRE